MNQKYFILLTLIAFLLIYGEKTHGCHPSGRKGGNECDTGMLISNLLLFNNPTIKNLIFLFYNNRRESFCRCRLVTECANQYHSFWPLCKSTISALGHFSFSYDNNSHGYKFLGDPEFV